MSLKSVFANTLAMIFGKQPATTETVKTDRSRKLGPYARKNGHWVKRQLESYQGNRMVVVKVPQNMPMDCAQRSVRSYLKLRFGTGVFTTRAFATARTVHINPKSA